MIKIADIDKLMERGDKAFEIQDVRRASKFFKRVLEINDAHVEALQKLAVCYSFTRKADLAIGLLNRALSLNPDKETRLELLSNLANAFTFKGEKTKDSSFYDKAIEINKIMLDDGYREGVYLNLGNLYKYKKDFDESIRTFNEAFEKYPNSPRLMVHLGNALRGKAESSEEELAKAIELYKKAKKIDPKYIGSYLNLGLTYISQGEEKLAEKEFLEAYKVNPEDPQLLNNYGAIGYYS